MQRSALASSYLAVVLLLFACQASGPPARGEAPSGAAAPPVAALAPVAPTAVPTPTRLVLSYSNLTPNQWPIWIAHDAGIFARHGLDVDVRLMESSTGVPALIAGDTQAAVLGGSEVLGAAAEGADLAIVAGLSRTFAFRFMANASIQRIDDLRGKRVGVSRIGSSSDIATRLALQRLGLVPDEDVEVIQVGSLTARIQALETGAIQGAVTELPDTTRLGKMGYHVLFDLSDLGLPAATDIVAVRRGDLTEQRATVQALVDAVVEAIAVQRTNRAVAQAVLARWLQTDDPDALAETGSSTRGSSRRASRGWSPTSSPTRA
jgi:NitT/TauT family transport system substrate-binding protein